MVAFVVSGEVEEMWETTWEDGNPSKDNVPAKVVMTVIDDIEQTHTAEESNITSMPPGTTWEDLFPSNDASITGITVAGVAATVDTDNETVYNVELPFGTDLGELTAKDIVVTPTDINATVADAVKTDGGATWTVVVTAEDGTTTETYTINVTVKNLFAGGDGTEEDPYQIETFEHLKALEKLPVDSGKLYYVKLVDDIVITESGYVNVPCYDLVMDLDDHTIFFDTNGLGLGFGSSPYTRQANYTIKNGSFAKRQWVSQMLSFISVVTVNIENCYFYSEIGWEVNKNCNPLAVAALYYSEQNGYQMTYNIKDCYFNETTFSVGDRNNESAEIDVNMTNVVFAGAKTGETYEYGRYSEPAFQYGWADWNYGRTYGDIALNNVKFFVKPTNTRGYDYNRCGMSIYTGSNAGERTTLTINGVEYDALTGTMGMGDQIPTKFVDARNNYEYVTVKEIGSNSYKIDGTPVDYKGIVLAPVVNVTSNTYYDTIQEAINAAEDGETILVSAGVYDEEIIVNKDKVKSITILGVNADTAPTSHELDGTVITGGIYIGTDASAAIEKSVTIKGITFNGGKGLLLGNIQTVTVENNKFIGITETFNGSTADVGAIAVIDPYAGGSATIKNNYIYDVQSVEGSGTTGEGFGIYIRKPTTVNIIGNYIEKTAHNSILISGTSTVPQVSITGNTLKDWDTDRDSDGGRAIRINFDPVDANTGITVTGNTFCPNDDDDPTDLDYVKITGVSTANNNVNNLIYSLINDNTWPDGTDYSKVILVNNTPGTNMAASVTDGTTTNYYPTIQTAINAAGEEETEIDIISDIDIEWSTAVYLEIPGNKNIILDLKGHTISGISTREGESYLIYNKGILKIKDSVGNGKLTYKSDKPDGSYWYGTSTIFNRGTLTVESGTVENTTNGGASYAVDNQTMWYDAMNTITFNLVGGNITCTSGDAAIRQAAGLGTQHKLNDKVVENYVNINGGTVTGDIWIQNLLPEDKSSSHSEINITDGTITGKLYTTCANENNVDNLTYKISGGNIHQIGRDGGGSIYKTGFITGGTFDVEPKADYIASGYKVIAENGKYVVIEDETKDMGELSMSRRDTIDPAIEETKEELDLTPLEDAIETALVTKEGLAVSEDGTDLPAGAYWVTQEDMDAIDAAIAAAEVARENAEIQEDIDDAIADLEAAIAAFNDAKQEAIDEEEIEEAGEGEELEE